MTTNRRELLIAGLGTALVACGHAAAHGRGDEHEEEEEVAEDQRFGARGFEGVVDEVAGLEATVGIADLAKFTPTA